ncbi:hypothetical protein MARCHEWKA_01900 [Brevundimonas phage vB_BpoS-Marchewka]|uniref:Uncharacterized protein n=1 Tax=Brevundimonas phage vB_BpoS-Marchewka TaxID=2948604 RepID=A0A9E7N2S4_9CAUD|nr:hypothetical protein MARCHEWKA_01900 [Brevundimonas phage vB_BpoS-Marchewka]UTC29149.1 hypothetical protein BAMBUS_00660 [Brevundimonas phage vB_BpoS-Bambus]
MTYRKRFDALTHGDLFYLDLDRGVIALSYGITTVPDGQVQIHYVLPGDGSVYRRTVTAAHQTLILTKPSRAEVRELKAYNGLHAPC